MAITLTILTLRHLIRQYQYVIPVYRHMSIYISFGYNSLLLCIIIGGASYMYLGYMYRLNTVNRPSTMLNMIRYRIETLKNLSIRSGVRLGSMTYRFGFIKKNLVKLRYPLRLVMSIIDVCATIIDVL